MEHLGAGLAALGVVGPGIGIGILAGMSSAAIETDEDDTRERKDYSEKAFIHHCRNRHIHI